MLSSGKLNTVITAGACVCVSHEDKSATTQHNCQVYFTAEPNGAEHTMLQQNVPSDTDVRKL